jgi:hypothetical protein
MMMMIIIIITIIIIVRAGTMCAKVTCDIAYTAAGLFENPVLSQIFTNAADNGMVKLLIDQCPISEI